MSGKGDTPRPIKVDEETYKSNWERIFGSTKPQRTGTEAEEVLEAIAELSTAYGDG